MAAGSFGGRSVSYTRIRFCLFDDSFDEVHADHTDRYARTTDAAKNDDVSDACNDVMGNVERTGGTVNLLVFRKCRQFRAADGY